MTRHDDPTTSRSTAGRGPGATARTGTRTTKHPTADPLPPRAVVGGEALAALAVPVRLALLSHLLAAGPRTASQCAVVVGETPSNCSWHLRALAEVGLVERAEAPASDTRNRPWQAAAVGFEFSDGNGPGDEIVRQAFEAIAADHEIALFGRYMARRAVLPAAWTAAEHASAFSLHLTPRELERLVEKLNALIRPFVRPIRSDAPAGSSIVHLQLRAFLDPDVYTSARGPSTPTSGRKPTARRTRVRTATVPTATARTATS